MKDVIVIGAGIIGATIAKALRAQGREVLLLDSGEALAGTPPSGGHLKPSWFGGMPKDQYEPAMQLLDDVWGLHQDEFLVWPVGIRTTVYRVDTDKVVAVEKTKMKVAELKNVNTLAPTVIGEGFEERCRLLIVAAGVWCAEILKPYFPLKIQSKQGISFRFKGKLENQFIKPWTPYRQIVAHQQYENEIWIGDGTAILQKNWTAEREEQCRVRCSSTIKAAAPPTKILTGLRPYCQAGANPCLFSHIPPRTFVVTGAGKSGTIGAGWAARRIIDATT